MTASRPRDVGILVFLGADALFWLGCFVMAGFARARADAWPDVPAAAQVAPTLPLLAAGALVLAALLYRARFSLLLCLLATTACLALVALTWYEASRQGLAWTIDARGENRYGFIAYGLTLLWSLHVLPALAALGVQAVRRRHTPLVGRYLAFQAAVGALIVLTVFLW